VKSSNLERANQTPQTPSPSIMAPASIINHDFAHGSPTARARTSHTFFGLTSFLCDYDYSVLLSVAINEFTKQSVKPAAVRGPHMYSIHK
jgi:hypothetical protein